jgi:hypothetical protein
MLLFACGKDSGNPANSGKTSKSSFAVTGRVLQVIGCKGLSGFEVILSGEGVSKTVRSDSLGNFTFPELSSGTYTVKASKTDYIVEPEERTITLNGDDARVEVFMAELARRIKDNESYLCGWVLTADGTPLIPGDVKVSIQQAEAKSPNVSLTVINNGYYDIMVLRENTVTVVPEFKGFKYEFPPQSKVFIPGKPIVICNFTAEPINPAFHTVSGRALDDQGKPVWALISLGNPYIIGLSIYSNTSTGEYSFRVPDGEYTVRINSNYRFEPDELQVTVKGVDVRLPDVSGPYIGGTRYTFAGRVVDSAGNGIPGVHMLGNWGGDNPVTGQDGRYEKQNVLAGVSPIPDAREIVIHPSRQGYTFSPDSTSVTVTRREGVEHGGTVTVPDFVGFSSTGKGAPVR